MTTNEGEKKSSYVWKKAETKLTTIKKNFDNIDNHPQSIDVRIEEKNYLI